MADDITVGSVGVKIVPDARGWDARMEAEFATGAKQIGRNIGRIIGDEIHDHIVAAMPEGLAGASVQAPARTKGAQAGRSFADSLKNTLRIALKNLPDVKIDADSSSADLALSNLRIKLEALSKKTVGVDIDSGEAMAELEALQAEMNRLGAESADIAVKMDTAQASAELDKFKAKIDRFKTDQAKIQVEADTARAIAALAEVGIEAKAVDAESPTIQVDADVAGAMAQLAAVGIEARVIGQMSPKIDLDVDSSGLEKAGSSASMATSHITLLIGAAAALAPLLVAVGAAAVGAFAAIGAGAAAIGAGLGVAILALKPVISAYQAINAAKTQKSAGQSSSQDSIASAQAQVTSAERTLANTRSNVADQAQDAARRVIQAKQSEAHAERESARNIVTAEEGVKRARQQAGDMAAQAESTLAQARQTAARQNEQALQQQRTAENNLQSAQQAARTAQQNLTQARKDAAEQLKQLQFQTEDAALSQRDAELQVQETQQALAKTLADPNASQRDKDEAQLAYEQAIQTLKEQTDAADQLAKKNKAAQKAGVEGSDAVKNAKKAEQDANQKVLAQQAALITAQKNVVLIQQQGAARIADAQRAVIKAQVDGAQQIADAERQLNDARVSGAERVRSAQNDVGDAERQQSRQARQGAFQVAQAQDAVVNAQRSLKKAYTDAGGAGSTAANKVKDALAKLTPAGKNFLAFIMKAKGGFDELSRVAQDSFLPGLQRGLEALAPLWQPFLKLVRSVGKAFGDVMADAGKALGGPLGKDFLDFLNKNLGPWLKLSSSIFGNYIGGVIKLFEAFGPTATNFLSQWNDSASGFNKWASGAAKSKGFQDFLAYVNRVGPKVFKLIGEIATTVGKLIGGLAPLGELMVDLLIPFFDAVNNLDSQQLMIAVAGIATLIAIATSGGTVAVIIAVIAALAAAVSWFKDLYNKDEDFRKSVDKTAAQFKKGFQDAWKTVGPIFKQAGDAINDDLVTGIKELFSLLSKVPSGVWKAYFLTVVFGPLILAAKAITFTHDNLKALIDFMKAPKTVAALKVGGAIISAPFVTAGRVIASILGNKGVRKSMSDLWKWVSTPYKAIWKGVKAVFTNPVQAAKDTIATLTSAKGLRRVFMGVSNWATGPWRVLWRAVKAVLVNPVSDALRNVSSLLGIKGMRSPFVAVKEWVKGAWSKTWNGISYTITHPVDAARKTLSKILGVTGIQSIFSKCVTAIGRIWDKVGDKVSGPINFILGIFNWFAKQFNKIGSKVGFTIPDNLSVHAPKKSGGGSVGNGGGHTAPDRGYAKGGQVLPRRRDGGPIPGPWRGETADNVLGLDRFGKPTAQVNPGEYITRVRSTRSMQKEFPGFLEYINENGRPPGFSEGGLLPHYALGGGPASGPFPTSGFSDRWQWNLIKKHFPAAVLTSAYRPGARTAGSGAQSYHAIGRAIDIGGSNALKTAVAKWILKSYGNATHDLLYSGLWGKMGLYEGKFYPQAANTVAEHYNHVHWGLRLGGGKGGKGFLGNLKDWVGDGLGFLERAAFSPVKNLFGKKLDGLKKFNSPFATKFLPGLGKKLLSSAIDTALSFGGGDSTSALGDLMVPGNVSGSKAIGKNMAGQLGWKGDQWSALYKLWMGESGWNPLAYNASSGATGIPQALPGSKMASAGPKWRTDPATQIKWGLGYIKQVYGSPLRAYSKWMARSPHWYAGGGEVRGNSPADEAIWSMLMQGDPDRDVAREAPVFDNGGTLARGLNLVNNQTGGPEKLIRADRTGGPHLTFNGVKYDSANEVAGEVMYRLKQVNNGPYGELLV